MLYLTLQCTLTRRPVWPGIGQCTASHVHVCCGVCSLQDNQSLQQPIKIVSCSATTMTSYLWCSCLRYYVISRTHIASLSSVWCSTRTQSCKIEFKKKKKKGKSLQPFSNHPLGLDPLNGVCCLVFIIVLLCCWKTRLAGLDSDLRLIKAYHHHIQ